MPKYTLEVAGMTCDHCVQAVTKEMTALAEVTDVAIALDKSGTSTLTVDATAEIGADRLRQAVGDAGYDTVGEIAGL
jgi:copper chaperone CopZ